MASSDWTVLLNGGGGADVLSHSAVLHSLLSPALPRPVTDLQCRRIENDLGASYGHAAFLYSRVGTVINITDDVSIRAALRVAVRGVAGLHSVGLGVRMEGLPAFGPTSNPLAFTRNGYHLLVVPGLAAYTLYLVRVEGYVATVLWSDSRAGSLGDYKWFHLRLDAIVQPHGDLRLQVFENDLTVNDVDSPVWGSAVANVLDPAIDVYSGSSGVGFGGQCKAGSDYDSYVDWVELYRV